MTSIDGRFETAGYGVVLEGADAAIKAIRALAPDLAKQMNARLREVGGRIIADARTRVPSESPLSRWERQPQDPAGWAAKRNRRPSRGGAGWPVYDSGTIKAGLKSTTAKPRSAKHGAVLFLTNQTPAGAILEVAGRKNSGAPGTAGAHFLRVLNDVDAASRVIWDAYDDAGRKKTQQAVIDAVQDAERELQRRLGAEGFTEVRR